MRKISLTLASLTMVLAANAVAQVAEVPPTTNPPGKIDAPAANKKSAPLPSTDRSQPQRRSPASKRRGAITEQQPSQ